jgi:hypothetical protein
MHHYKSTTKLYSLLASLLVGFAIFSTGTVPTIAQSNEGPDFSVNPISHDLSLLPGQSQELNLTVSNDLPEIATFRLSAGVFNSAGELSAEPEQSESSDWLNYPTSQINLVSGQSQQMTFNLTLPADATPGVYYLAAIISLEQNSDSQTSSSAVIAQIAQRINLNVLASNVARPSLSIAELGGPSVMFSGDATYNWSVQNVSDLFTRPVIYTQIVSPAGEILRTEVQNSELNLIGPGDTEGEVLQANSDLFTQPGIYRFEILVVDSVNDEAPVISKYVGTLYIPLWLALIGALASVVAAATAIYTYRRFAKHEK